MNNNIEKMRTLIKELNEAARVYYQGQDEIISNLEYDNKYDELESLEQETGVVLAGSPTTAVGYETLSELPKERHVAPMLSLDKTKEVTALQDFLADKNGILSLKLDGLSVIVTYQNGILVKALTRGNGEVGEVITNNAKTFKNLPYSIPFDGYLVVRGEALIKYSDFENMNNNTTEIAEKYKNPRNLCSGSVRQLNNEVTAKRHVNYLVYNLVETDADITFSTRKDQIDWLFSLGFEIVPNKMVTKENIEDTVSLFSNEIEKNDLPSDGLVLAFDDLEYSQSLGRTAKFPRDSIAFKWKDELAQTTLLDIEWSASRTGLINPVAIFEPVELEGTTVQRASVHNISILKELKLGIGDEITVYKANMIIPQINENLTQSENIEIPNTCPVCHGQTKLVNENGSEVLMCENEECLAKRIKSFTHFVGRDAMNIEGLSESTLEKFIAKGFIKEPSDLFHLEQYKDELTQMDGFGEKSYANLIEAIEKSRSVSLARLVYSLGIKGIGLSMAKLICNRFSYDLPEMKNISKDELIEIEGVGEVLADNFVTFFQEKLRKNMILNLWKEVSILREETNQNKTVAGLTFVITGSLSHFENRSACKAEIENRGGKVTGSVTKNTNYLVNNDIHSNSSKNKKAQELSVPIISEETLLEILGE